MAKNSLEGILSLRDMTGGMSSDEYVGGSFLVGEKIDIFSDSQSYRLAKGVGVEIINNRSSGGITEAIYVPYMGVSPLLLSNDGYIESPNSWNDGSTGTVAPTSSGFGALYRKSGALLLGQKTVSGSASDIFIIGSKLDRLKISNDTEEAGIMDTVTNLINPGLTSNTGRTVGTGWTTGAGGAVHTAGNTAVLSQSISPTVTGKYRIVVRVSSHTAGTLQVRWRSSSVGTIQAAQTGRLNTYVFDTGGTSSGLLELVPNSAFDGTVKYVDLREYNSNLIVDEVTLSSSSPTCYFQDGGFLYVGNGNYIDIIDTTPSTWILDDTLEFPNDHTIVGITRIGNTLNIYCRDGADGWKYFWNGVDNFPSEKVQWKGLQPYSVENDGNIDYVILRGYQRDHLAKSSGRDKQIMYSSIMDLVDSYQTPAPSNHIMNTRFLMPSTNGRGLAMGDGFLGVTGLDSIMIYGSGTSSTKKGITGWYKTGNAFNSSNSRFIKYVSGRFYTSYYDTTDPQLNNYLASWNMMTGITRSYTSSGYIIYNPTFRDKLSTKKELIKLKIGCNLEQSDQKINIYASIDDWEYITFTVSGVTTAPVKGDTYTAPGFGTHTVISTDITGGAGTIGCKWNRAGALFNFYQMYTGQSLTKVTGSGDSTISIVEASNFIRIHQVTGDNRDMKGTLVFTPDKALIDFPSWNKIQFKVELIRGANLAYSPEVYNLEVLARPVQNEGI